ncbi:MAG: aminoacyl-tRNA hydrolase [bacterium]|nr:aminoacyl-tRNA hydrolase [bacterium]
MIEVTPDIRIAEDELSFSFVRASGPGGQNVNKVSTAVQLRFDAANSPNLPEAVRARALRLAGRRATTEGVIVLDARRHRTQERNRQDAVERLVALLQRAAELPKPRTSTKPTRASRIKRLDDKRRRSAVKRARIQRDEE